MVQTINLGSWINNFGQPICSGGDRQFQIPTTFAHLQALYYHQQRYFLLLAYACRDEWRIPFFHWQRWQSFHQYSIQWANTLNRTTTLHTYTLCPDHSSDQCTHSEHYLQHWQTLLYFHSHWFRQGLWMASCSGCARGFDVLLFFMPCWWTISGWLLHLPSVRLPI